MLTPEEDMEIAALKKRGWSISAIARHTGRDRKTVQYACHTVEDLREDREFDGIISQMERVATAMLGNRTTG